MTDTPMTSPLMDFFADNMNAMPDDTTTVDMAKAILYMLTGYGIAPDDAKAILEGCASTYEHVFKAAREAEEALLSTASTDTSD